MQTLAAALGGAALLTLIGVVLRPAGEAYPTGDGAVLELYTLQAAKGLWALGPYSQYGWHHPGPLFFYWEVPWYVASGFRMVGLHAGALALCVASLGTVLAVLARLTGPAVCLSAAVLLGGLALRASPLPWTFWNPYVVVLPVTVLLVLAAGLASGRWRWLVLVIVVASFLVQTHVSLVPTVAAVVGVGCIAALRHSPIPPGPSRRRSVRLAVIAAGVAWALPIYEQLTSTPGNLTKLARFFYEPATPLPWRTAAAVWSDHVVAVLLPDFGLPGGRVVTAPDIEPWSLAGAVGQLVLLGLIVWWASRRHDHVMTGLALVGMTASLVGLWSITRIRGPLTDYAVFWQSGVGGLNWAVIIGAGLGGLPGLNRVFRGPPRLVEVVSGVVLVAVAATGAVGIRGVMLETRIPAGAAALVRDLADLVQARASEMRAPAVVIRVSQPVWVEAAGLVLQLRKRGVPATVDGDVGFVFGLPPDGSEGAVFELTRSSSAESRTNTVEADRVGDIVVRVRLSSE